ncbi:MAG: pitrilysin family protein [Syntrophomonadaceae bacterium]|nr:pitrilysin family protein [Syntrophomonadaceae bacterium]
MTDYWNLNNKTKLVVEEIPYVKSVAIGIYIKVGSRHEPLNLTGASHFIEHMLFKGTDKRSAREIAASFERIGGQLNAYTGKEYTCLYARILDENLEMALEILLDMLFNSQFTNKEFTTEKGVVLEEINMSEDTPDDLVHEIFARQLWSGHTMGLPILGTAETVANFDRQAIIDFYHKHYVPANMVVSVAGNINREKIHDIIETEMNKHIVDFEDLPAAETGYAENFVQLQAKDTEQMQICVGVPGISYNNDLRFTQNVMNSILGGGMSSRLFQHLREEMGLAYSVYSYASNYSDTGSFAVYIGTSPGRITETFQGLKQQLDDICENGVSEEEVLRTRQLIKSSMYLGMESVVNQMARIGKSIVMFDQVIPLEEVLDKILSVDQKMIKNLASQLWQQQKVSLACVGPAGVLPQAEAEFKKWWF